MKDQKLQLLKKLVETPSPSGFEEKVANYIENYLKDFLPRTRVIRDYHNQVTAIIKGTSKKNVMIDAHLDTIGLIIINIDELGFVSLDEIGGVDKDIVQGRPVTILSYRNKIINGVIDKKPIHHLAPDETTRPDKFSDLSVNLDVGVRKGKNVGYYVRVGDPLIFKPSFSHMLENYYYGYGCDDKVGCFVLLETIKKIAKSKIKPYANLIFTFSSQEETESKLKSLIGEYKPEVFIELDVTTATDVDPEENFEREVGKCDLGKGIVIYRGVGLDKEIIKVLERTARSSKVKCQFQATNGNMGYMSEVFAGTNGLRVATLGIPLRNMHTPVEVINRLDLENGVKLLRSVLLGRRLKTLLKK